MQKILNLPFVDNLEFIPQCQAYLSLVSYWNTITNLISSRDVDNLLIHLIRQSVQPLATEILSKNSVVLDVGSGAGLPGLPLKFARPELRLTLLEPRRKKSLFLQRVVDELKLKNVTVIRQRIEEFSILPDNLQKFDLITARGTGTTDRLLPILLPLLRRGGSCWFYKGSTLKKEMEDLERLHPGKVRQLVIDSKLSVIVFQVS